MFFIYLPQLYLTISYVEITMCPAPIWKTLLTLKTLNIALLTFSNNLDAIIIPILKMKRPSNTETDN